MNSVHVLEIARCRDATDDNRELAARSLGLCVKLPSMKCWMLNALGRRLRMHQLEPPEPQHPCPI